MEFQHIYYNHTHKLTYILLFIGESPRQERTCIKQYFKIDIGNEKDREGKWRRLNRTKPAYKQTHIFADHG